MTPHFVLMSSTLSIKPWKLPSLVKLAKQAFGAYYEDNMLVNAGVSRQGHYFRELFLRTESDPALQLCIAQFMQQVGPLLDRPIEVTAHDFASNEIQRYYAGPEPLALMAYQQRCTLENQHHDVTPRFPGLEEGLEPDCESEAAPEEMACH